MKLLYEGMPLEFDGVSNAAGTCKTPEEIAIAIEADVPEPALGSITLAHREINGPGNTFYYDEATGNSVNSLGIPNGGWEYYSKNLVRMVRSAQTRGKRLRISVAEFSPESMWQLIANIISLLEERDLLDWIILELNFGCPNCWDGGQQKQIVAYAPEVLIRILRDIFNLTRGRVRLAIKLSPYDKQKRTYVQIRSDIATGLKDELYVYHGAYPKAVVELVLANTVPNYFMRKPDGSPALDVTNGYGGLAGRGLKPYIDDNLAFFRNALPDIPLVAAGGIQSAADVLDYLKRGATKVQLNTEISRNKAGLRAGFKVIPQINQGLIDLVTVVED